MYASMPCRQEVSTHRTITVYSLVLWRCIFNPFIKNLFYCVWDLCIFNFTESRNIFYSTSVFICTRVYNITTLNCVHPIYNWYMFVIRYCHCFIALYYQQRNGKKCSLKKYVFKQSVEEAYFHRNGVYKCVDIKGVYKSVYKSVLWHYFLFQIFEAFYWIYWKAWLKY